MPGTLHEQAIDILHRHLVSALGGELMADAKCNECPENHPIDLVKDAVSVKRGPHIGSVVPDLVLFSGNDEPITFVEVVVSHAPEWNVHLYAIEHDIRIVEFHMNATKEMIEGRKRQPTLDKALVIKSRLEDIRSGHLHVDGHNLLCQRPRCSNCREPLPRRTISIRTTDCWKCGKNVKVAVGSKDSEDLYPSDFTSTEREFVRQQDVLLQVRYSATAKERYLANVCGNCDQIQGNWFLYDDPHHDRFMLHTTERSEYGPCDACAEHFCHSHGKYYDYGGDSNCPTCRYEAECTPCRHDEARECFYPDTCRAQGCYFLRR